MIPKIKLIIKYNLQICYSAPKSPKFTAKKYIIRILKGVIMLQNPTNLMHRPPEIVIYGPKIF